MFYDSSSASSPASGKSKSHLAISPATPRDVRRLVDIEFYAFEDERANQQLSYRDHTKPEHFERTVCMYVAALNGAEQYVTHPKGSRTRSDSAVEPAAVQSTVSFRKVTDIDTEQVVSFAKAEIKAYSEGELLSPADAGHECEPPMNRDWFGLNERLRREYMGLQKHCYIGMLATLPCYQHRGAGTMLLGAILDEADEAGLEVYLEATDTAKPLYAKHGFAVVNEIRFDTAVYSIRDIGKERQTVMVRGLLRNDGRRAEVKSWRQAAAQANAGLHRITRTA